MSFYSRFSYIIPNSCQRFDTAVYFYRGICLFNDNQKKTVVEKVLTTHQYKNGNTLSPVITDTVTYNYYDTGANKGRLNWQRQGNLDGAVTTTYTDYKPTGVYGKKTVSVQGCDPRMETYQYDNTQRFVTKITNPDFTNFNTYFTYDAKTGNKLTETDMNGLTTHYTYNTFGNLTKIVYPDGTQTTDTVCWYTATQIPNARYYTKTTSSGKPTVEIYYDVLGREVCRKEDDIFYDTRYNAKGQVLKTSYPYTKLNEPDNSKSWYEYTYDDFGRQNSVKMPYSNLSYTYHKSTVTITDSLRGISSYKKYDALGRIIEAHDEGGTINYTYSVITQKNIPRHQTTITANDATTTIISDLLGNRLSIEEPNAGTITSTYNKFNELVEQTDARGNITSYEYDKLGRVTQKKYTDMHEGNGEPDLPEEEEEEELRSTQSAIIHTYTYDNYTTTNRGRGKLHTIQINGSDSETFTYDAYSRLTEHDKLIDNESYKFNYTYNTNGQLHTLTYPDNFTVNYSYSSAGKLTEIKNGSNLIYKISSRNKYNAPTLCSFGNNLATDYTYNPYGLLTRIYTKDNSQAAILKPINGRGKELLYEDTKTILNYNYTYDNKGLMTSRTDSVLNCYENFTYDDLDRLTKITIGITQQSFSYNDNGNIENNSKRGTYTYAHPKKVHAVTSIEPINSDAISSAQCDVTYNFFNQPATITEDDYLFEIFYDANQQRNKTIKQKNDTIETTRYYISKHYEKEINHNNNTVRHFNYIYGDNGAVALHIANDNTGKDTLYYIHTDHLGSYCAITTDSAKVVQRNGFDPWGNRYYLETQIVKDSIPELEEEGEILRGLNLLKCHFNLTRRGFTGHEHYPEFKIINMNARLYDPVIGRFFSPDNYVVDNQHTQDFNRYSYARNNPLMYTDPTGNLYNPVYDKHGNPLGETSEGFTGVPLIYEGTNKVEWSKMTAEKATKKYNLTQLQKTDLSAESFSKIYTHILEKGGFFTSKLMGKAVAVRNGSDQFNNPDLKTELFSGSLKYPSKVTVNQLNPYTKQMLTTVENIWNMLGAHETVAHGQYQFGTIFKTHHKAYEYQINHSTWDNTTSEYKGLVLQNYLRHLDWEVPGSRSSSEYLKYHNLMNLYLKK